MKAELIGVFGSDEMVVDTARVTFDKHAEQYTPEQNAKLIHYLANYGHWSPFSHPKAQFRITAPIFIARQWEKHRVGSVRGYDIYDHNEVSRRYVDDEPTCFVPEEWRTRPDGSVKQGSGEPLAAHAKAVCDGIYNSAIDDARVRYEALLKYGVAPEQARMVLPQSMYTTWIETGSLAYWARLCVQRLDAHAQREIAELAKQVDTAMAQRFPVSWSALMENEA